jgi:hypothetical protein
MIAKSMKKTFKFLILASILLVFSAAAFAQKTTRINFRKGAKTAIVSGYLNGYKDRKIFVIRVRRGQTLQVEQIKSENSLHYVTVSIDTPTGEEAGDWDASCNSDKLVERTRAGNYRITVFECQKADAWRGRFALRVAVK